MSKHDTPPSGTPKTPLAPIASKEAKNNNAPLTVSDTTDSGLTVTADVVKETPDEQSIIDAVDNTTSQNTTSPSTSLFTQISELIEQYPLSDNILPQMQNRAPNDPCMDCDTKDTDAEILERLSVYDPEGDNFRPYNEENALIEVAPKSDEKDEILIRYTGPETPSELTTTKDGIKQSAISGNGSGTYIAEVEYDAKLKYKFLPFTRSAPVQQYRYSGLPKTIKANVYNGDQWKLSFSLPPIGKREIGVKYTSKKDKKDQNRNVTVKSVDFHKAQESSPDTDYTPSKEGFRDAPHKAKDAYEVAQQQFRSGFKMDPNSTEETHSKFPIILRRNNVSIRSDVTSSKDLKNALNAANNVANVIKEILDLYKKVKALGTKDIAWYFDLDFSIFQGNLTLAWGWREKKNYQVYYYQSAEADLTILQINLEFGFGVKVSKIEGQVYTKVNGNVDLKIPFYVSERRNPETIELATNTVEIEVGIGIRVDAGKVIKVKGEAVSAFIVTVKAAFKKADFIMDGTIKWDGVRVKFEAAVFCGFWSTNGELNLIEPKDIANFRFPSADTPAETNSYNSEKELRKDIMDMLTDGLNYDFHTQKEHVGWFNREYTKDVDVSLNTVSKIISERIWEEQIYLDMDKKIIGSLIKIIDDWLDIEEENYGYFDNSVSIKALEKYLNGDTFKKHIENAHCPYKKYKRDTG